MTKPNLYTKANLENMFPHLLRVYRTELEKAYEEFIHSEKFIKTRDEYENEEDYKTFMESVEENETFIKETLEETKDFLLKRKDYLTYGLIHGIFDTEERINSWRTVSFLDDKFNEITNTIKNSTEKNIVDNVISLYKEQVNDILNGYKERFAINKLNIRKQLTKAAKDEITFVMQSMSIADDTEIENKIKNHFNYTEQLFAKENEEIIGWDSEYEGYSNSYFW